MSYLDPNVVTKVEKERRLKAAQKETKVANASKTLKMILNI